MDKPKKSKALCSGCNDDYYNHNVAGGCWSFRKARVKRRFTLNFWTAPTVPGAVKEVYALDCYNCKGYVHFDTLPRAAVDPVLLTPRRKKKCQK